MAVTEPRNDTLTNQSRHGGRAGAQWCPREVGGRAEGRAGRKRNKEGAGAPGGEGRGYRGGRGGEGRGLPRGEGRGGDYGLTESREGSQALPCITGGRAKAFSESVPAT